MSTNYSEFKRRVMLNLGKTDAQSILAVEQAINDAHRNIARVRDFDELMVLDTANATTTANQKLYHLTSNLGLTRPKDIYSIRYMDEDNSRKLQYVNARQWDALIPYPESTNTERPTSYTRRGMYLELFPIPQANKSLYIMHSQWPATLSNDSDETPYLWLDDVIITLATEIASGMLGSGIFTDWFNRAKILLGVALSEEQVRPDNTLVARPFCTESNLPLGEYWNNPFIDKV